MTSQRAPTEPVVILGGGLSGMAAAHALARAGCRHVTLVEGSSRLGGIAGEFVHEGRAYPLGYHHILHRDRTLLYVLDAIGALPAIRWRRIRMLFRLGGSLYDLGSPLGFLRFPMATSDKLRFVRLMLKAFARSDWDEWLDASAAELVDAWAGPGVREAIFEPLSQLRFARPSDEISGAWLGTRLHYREGSAPLGFQPGANWTTTLISGYQRLLEKLGVQIRAGAAVRSLVVREGRVSEALLDDGSRITGARFVNTLPAPVYVALAPTDATPGLADIRYTAMISLVCATRQRIAPDFYWMNLASLDHAACGIFLLSSLNPTLGAPGEHCVNFVSHLYDRQAPLFRRSDEEILDAYGRDFRRVFGRELEPRWHRVARIPLYAPAFVHRYRTPPLRSTTHANLYFAGSYCSHPTIASTGTAIASGFRAARALLRDAGHDTDLPEAAAGFRLAARPRARRTRGETR